jgi:hypothetical protein
MQGVAGTAALVSRAENYLKTPGTWFETLLGKAEPGTATPGLLQNAFCVGRSSREAIRADAPVRCWFALDRTHPVF